MPRGRRLSDTDTPPPPSTAGSINFGPFRFRPAERVLLEGDREIRLGSRALAILELLLERPGELIGKGEIIARVWPTTFVDDVNLRVHISALRRALGDGRAGRRYLVTVPGRGYQFVGRILAEDPATPPPARSPAGALPVGLPRPLTRIIGRDAVIAAALEQLRRWRFVTILGPGGIGKTTVALAMAERLAPDFPDGVQLIDLAAIQEDARIPAAVAAALGIASYASDATPGIVASLRAKRALLLLDSCERTVAGIAALVEQIMRAAPAVHVLATSRERLRAEGERVLRLPTLATPPRNAALTAAALETYGSVELFLDRATAINENFRLQDSDAAVMAAICQRLDGMALAIELAASHMGMLDLRSLAVLLEDRFRLTALGRRTALPRHQTLRTVLDWSYATLSAAEKTVLCRLAVFEGMITVPATLAVLSESGMPRDAVIATLASLVDKSLVTADIDEAGVQYRLLDTTRDYALERLAEAGERDLAARQHALYYLDLATQVAADWAQQNTARWLVATFAAQLGNLRAALDWAFSPTGDSLLAIRLAVVGIPLMFELASVDEIRRRTTLVLARMEATGWEDRMAMLRMRAALGAAMMYNPGPVAETARNWEQVLEAATALDDTELRSRACWGLWTVHVYGGRPRRALEFAEQWRAHGQRQGSEVKALLADRITGTALHYLGAQRDALAVLEPMSANYVLYRHHWFTLGFEIDHGAMARITIARVLWLLGRPGPARQRAAEAVATVLAQGYPVACCYVLCEAAFAIALLDGDLGAAERALVELGNWADRNGLAIWQATLRGFRLALAALQGARLDRDAITQAFLAMRATGFTTHLTWLSAILAEALGAQGEVEAGLQLINAALATAEAGEEAWCRPEMLRVRAMLTASRQGGAEAAQRDLADALALARAQSALAWQLRIAISAVRLARTSADRTAAAGLLAESLGAYDGAEDTADLRIARGLLGEGPRMRWLSG